MTRPARLLCALFLAALGLATAAGAQGAGTSSADGAGQGPAMLVADRIFVEPDGRLVASGNVEAFHGTTRLSAARVIFDRRRDRLTLEGPIRIDDGTTVTVLAAQAELDPGLRDGLLTGARMVLDRQVQLAATQMARVNGRYTQLYRSAVTSCQVCETGQPPLWQIRARRVIHDQQEKQLYFEDAQLRVLDLPVFYLPRLRLPDPTLRRARGFLIPEIQTTSRLGTGVKVPYFFTLGDHADLTLAPYVSPRTRTLDFRYRQAFRRGRVQFEGALTKDDLVPDKIRGYLFGTGAFELGRGFRLGFDVSASTDDAYLREYGVSDADRLRSDITLERAGRDRWQQASVIYITSLRDTDDDALLPNLLADYRHEQRLFPRALGGETRLRFETHAHRRGSSADVAGRDVARATAEATWLRSVFTPAGLRADWRLGIAGDIFEIRQDSTYPDTVTVATPQAALALRLPMTRPGRDGATQLLEPLVQIAWTDVMGDPVPNDESNLVEFDAGNLLALSRFPAVDRREDGLSLAYGLNWARQADSGWQGSASFGQVIRQTADPGFTNSSGLGGTSSDFLLAGQVLWEDDLALTARTLFDDSFDFAKAELRGDWTGPRSHVSGTYLWLDADPAEGRVRDSSEIWFDGAYDVSRHWTASASWRFDIADARSTTAGIGLGYRNECVALDLSINRNFTSSTTVEPSTVFGFTIALRGFGVTDGTERYRKTCENT